jgi:hypothetical protein
MYNRRPGPCRACKVSKTQDQYILELGVCNPNLKFIGKYKNSIGKCTHKCRNCDHEWDITPKNALSGQGCPSCRPSGFSNISIEWIEIISTDIQHALNGGEYRIPNTPFRVDGYDPNTNTVYEFLGDCWHGNLNVYHQDATPHPYSNLTTKELNSNTMKRLDAIKSIGYNVIFIWEADYREVK